MSGYEAVAINLISYIEGFAPLGTNLTICSTQEPRSTDTAIAPGLLVRSDGALRVYTYKMMAIYSDTPGVVAESVEY